MNKLLSLITLFFALSLSAITPVFADDHKGETKAEETTAATAEKKEDAKGEEATADGKKKEAEGDEEPECE